MEDEFTPRPALPSLGKVIISKMFESFVFDIRQSYHRAKDWTSPNSIDCIQNYLKISDLMFLHHNIWLKIWMDGIQLIYGL